MAVMRYAHFFSITVVCSSVVFAVVFLLGLDWVVPYVSVVLNPKLQPVTLNPLSPECEWTRICQCQMQICTRQVHTHITPQRAHPDPYAGHRKPATFTALSLNHKQPTSRKAISTLTILHQRAASLIWIHHITNTNTPHY